MLAPAMNAEEIATLLHEVFPQAFCTHSNLHPKEDHAEI